MSHHPRWEMRVHRLANLWSSQNSAVPSSAERSTPTLCLRGAQECLQSQTWRIRQCSHRAHKVPRPARRLLRQPFTAPGPARPWTSRCWTLFAGLKGQVASQQRRATRRSKSPKPTSRTGAGLVVHRTKFIWRVRTRKDPDFYTNISSDRPRSVSHRAYWTWRAWSLKRSAIG